jgi:hypothetical protein
LNIQLDPLQRIFNLINRIGWIFDVITDPMPLLIMVIYIICALISSHNYLDTYKYYVVQKEREYKITINALNSKLQQVIPPK